MGANQSLPGADCATSSLSLQASLLPRHQDHPASRRTSKSASSSSSTGSRTSQSSSASSSSEPEANGSPPPFEPKIQIVGLTRVGPDGALLLDRVSADVSRASITALIGPSGSGKSTVLRALNRLWEPNPGSVLLDGTDVTRLPVVQLRRRVGMLFQSAYLFDGTVADNVRYGPSLAGRQLTDGEVEALLDLVNLERSFADRPATSLSGGQAQRVALARALAVRPEVLLLDEPTSALDPAATIKIEESIRRLRDEQGLTVVWVSHSTEQVQRVADWVVLLVDGRVADSLAPADLHDGRHPLAEQFVAGKLESSKGPTLVEVEA